MGELMAERSGELVAEGVGEQIAEGMGVLGMRKLV